MDGKSRHEQRMIWAFWLACGLAAAGAVAPLLLAGGSTRNGGIDWPYALAAVALAACALLYEQGKPVAAGLYFVASLAIVYGVLALLTLPLRLAVVGTCEPAPALCAAGLERPLTLAETTAMGFVIGIGIVAIMTGFFGLVILYRRQALAPPPTPPERRIAAVGAKAPAQAVAAPDPAPEAAEVAPAVPAPEAAPEVVTPEPEPEPELPAHTEDLELAAPAEPLELPAPASEPAAEVARPKPPRKPRTPRAPKPPPPAPATPTPTDSDA